MPTFTIVHTASPRRVFSTFSPKVNEKTHLVFSKTSRPVHRHVCRADRGGTKRSLTAF